MAIQQQIQKHTFLTLQQHSTQFWGIATQTEIETTVKFHDLPTHYSSPDNKINFWQTVNYNSYNIELNSQIK